MTGRAGADLDERACRTWLDARRGGVAAVLRLALEGGWLADAALAAAFDGPRPNAALYGLFEEALAGLPGRVEALARRGALDPGRMPGWTPFATLLLEEGEGGVDLVLACESVWSHAFGLDELPPALAVAVARTLDLVGRQLAPCCFARDLAWWWFDEAEAAYREVRALGATDPDARWEAAVGQTAWADWYGWRDRDEFEMWWARLETYCEPRPRWLRRWLARGRDADARPTARRLLRLLRRWRRRPGLPAEHPWCRWLRRALLALARAARRWPEPPARALAREGEDGSEPLALAQPVGFGEPWEEGLLEEYYEHVACAGEGFRLALRADPDTPALGAALEAFAVGQGLLVGACQADALARGLPPP